MNSLTKWVAAAAISAAILIPAFTAIAKDSSELEKQKSELSSKKLEAEERKQQAASRRQQAKIKKAEVRMCVKNADAAFVEAMKEARVVRNNALEAAQQARMTGFAEAKELRDSEIEAAGDDKAAIQAAKEKYVATIKALQEKRFTDRKKAQADYHLLKKTEQQDRKTTIKACRTVDDNTDSDDDSDEDESSDNS